MKSALKTLSIALSFAGLTSLAMPASAAPFALEGELRAITTTTSATTVVLDCVGMKVAVNSTTALKTAVGRLTIDNLKNLAAFDSSGWAPSGFNGTVPATAAILRAGFKGGTCIVSGDDANSIVTSVGTYPLATAVDVSVAENVLVGVGSFTGATGPNDPKPGAGSQILGVPVVAIDDARMPTIKFSSGLFSYTALAATATRGAGFSYTFNSANKEYVRNGFGVGVYPASIAAGDTLTAGGYLGADGKMHAHTLESGVGKAINTSPRPIIQRAQCLNLPGTGDSVTIRGGCVLPAATASASITFYGIQTNGASQTLGTATCTRKQLADADNPTIAFGLYAFAGKGLTLAGDACPASIAAHQSGSAFADLVTPDVR